MNIRPFKYSDLPAILDIYSNSKLDELINEKNKFSLLPLMEDKKRFAELMESDIYVYEENAVVGYCAIFGNEIRALFVHPNRRKKGLGKLLLEHLLSLINGPAVLYVAKSNCVAKEVYKKYGFKVTGEFVATYNKESVLANEMVRNMRNC